MDADSLIAQISPPLDKDLATALIAEFVDLECRFALSDWEPATLNGGQFTEIASRIVYHIDSGTLNPRKSVNDCLIYVENDNNSNGHSFPNRRAALHLCKALRTIYKFRSDRGAIHIDLNYTANELDSTLILSLSRWVMSEILRVFWRGDSSEVARVIREIVRYRVPGLFKIDGRTLVLSTNCTAEEEILLLLYDSGEAGLSRDEIGKATMKSAPSVTKALKVLISPAKRQVVKQDDGQCVLTPNGAKRVHDELSGKLSLA